MGAWFYPTNTSLAIDPDFGKRAIAAGSIYRVNVTPADTKEKKWTFYLLMPELDPADRSDDPEEETEEIQHICEKFLDMGDYYEVINIKDEDGEAFDSSTPILTFHPNDDEEFLWLCPPKTARH